MTVVVICLAVCALAGAASIGEDRSDMNQYDTIVIGMGAAGTTAASTLAQAGRKVLGLEAQNRIGGRVNTVQFGDGLVELGAEWIHGQFPSRTYDLAMKNNISLISQDISMDVYRSDGSKGNNTLINELVNFALEVEEDPPEVPEPLGQYITRRVMEYLKEKYPEALNDQDFLTEFFHFADLVIDNYESSNSWNDVTTATQYQDLGGDQHLSWHTYGYKTLFDILLNRYNNGPGLPTLTVKLDTEVTKVTWSQDPNAKVTVTTKDGTVYSADNVIVTVSVGVLKERHKTLFTPELPQKKIDVINHLSIGLLDKNIFLFPEKFWNGLSDGILFSWRPEDKKSLASEDLWMYNVVGASVSKGNRKALIVWTFGDTARLVETLPEDVVKSKLMGLLRRFLGSHTDIPEPIDMIRSTWYSNPFTRGSYTYDNIESPKYPTIRADLAEPLTDSAGKPRVLFAGEATNPTHFSTVHGATDTGYREAMRLLPTSSKI